MREQNYVRIIESSIGFAHVNRLVRDNPDCLYNGLFVTPEDKDQILFRWKLDDGTYQVVYGDLRTRHASKFALPE